MMSRRFRRPGLLAAALLASAAAVAVARTQVFLETGEEHFAQGRAEGVVWTSLGTLRLGRPLANLLPQTEGVDYVAAFAEAPDGTVYAVTGGAGRVYRVKDAKVDLFATLEDKFLFCCAADKNGDVYVGSGGTRGRVWRLAPQPQGPPKAEVVFQADDVKYVWDLAWMKDGALAAATGDQGRLLRIPPGGKAEVLIDSSADHVLCLLAAPDGTLYAGTDGEALVYRWADRKAFILYDADEAEITGLALDDAGYLYVGASSGAGGRGGGVDIPPEPVRPAPPSAPPAAPTPGPEPRSPGDPAAKTGNPAGGEAPVPDAAAPAAAAPDRPPEAAPAARGKLPARPTPAPGGPAGASVYRIAPDGIVSRVFEGRDAMVLAVASAAGRLLVGTGQKARVHEVAGRIGGEEEACVANLDPKQVMALAAARDGRLLVGTAGPGRIYALSRGPAREGTYTSQVYDAGGSARWGALEWTARTPDGAEVRVATRTGNVRDPDKGPWSDWSKDAPRSPAKVESPAARYVQFRVTMRTRADGESPVLEELRAAYLRANEPPKVLSIGEQTLQDPNARRQAAERFAQTMKSRMRAVGPAPAGPPQVPPPEGAQAIRLLQWQARDPNQDALRYDLYFRSQGDSQWVLLERDLTQPQFGWDTATVADGWYEVKVVASDRADNPPDTAQEGEKISDPLLVDNTAPLIENLEVRVRPGGEADVRFTARDAASRLTEAAYTVDSAYEWRALAPVDGLFDGPQKEFRFTVRGLGPGPHRLAVRAGDEGQNIGHAARSVVVPEK